MFQIHASTKVCGFSGNNMLAGVTELALWKGWTLKHKVYSRLLELIDAVLWLALHKYVWEETKTGSGRPRSQFYPLFFFSLHKQLDTKTWPETQRDLVGPLTCVPRLSWLISSRTEMFETLYVCVFTERSKFRVRKQRTEEQWVGGCFLRRVLHLNQWMSVGVRVLATDQQHEKHRALRWYCLALAARMLACFSFYSYSREPLQPWQSTPTHTDKHTLLKWTSSQTFNIILSSTRPHTHIHVHDPRGGRG